MATTLNAPATRWGVLLCPGNGAHLHIARPHPPRAEGPDVRGGHMALADRVQSKPTRRHGIPCSVGELLDSLPEAETAALEQMLTGGWSQAEIHAAVTAEGHYVGRQTINRHRSQACRCYQAGAK